VSQAPILLVSLADFLQENWSSLIKPVMSLRMSGNSSAIYVLDELHRNYDARPPARTHAIEAANAHADLFVSLSRCASRASLGGGARRQTDLRRFSWPVFFFKLGEILSNFDLKNVISAYKKDFSWTNGPNSPDFQEKKIQNISDSYDKFQ